MAIPLQLAGSSGSFAANALLLLALETAGPLGDFPVSGTPQGAPPPATVALALPWRPFIDNPGEDPTQFDRRPRCPSPAAVGGGVRLDEAPLPQAYDAKAFPDRVIFGCVRVDREGRVTAVKLLNAPARLRGGLAAVIRHRWRFAVDPFAPSEPGWQRVRLNAGPEDEPVFEPPPPLL
jgi:hypothetical protein